MNNYSTKTFGPLAHLVGTWEGEKGEDRAPDDDPREVEKNLYRERIVFEPLDPVNNHTQVLHGLRYSTTAWRIGTDTPFHEELGYWLYDAKRKELIRCFMVPRGVTVLAGGIVEPEATEFDLSADAGSKTHGICSNTFLDEEFRTVRYELKVTLHEDGSFSYDEDTQLQIKGQTEIFHHTDANRLARTTR
jgi:hypothetical protein